jgi:hypothetical protein
MNRSGGGALILVFSYRVHFGRFNGVVPAGFLGVTQQISLPSLPTIVYFMGLATDSPTGAGGYVDQLNGRMSHSRHLRASVPSPKA